MSRGFSSCLVLMAIIILLANGSEGRKITRCDLAKRIQTLSTRSKFSKNDLANWVCLAEAESNLNTATISELYYDGTRSYGIFQINSKEWCSGGPNIGKNLCKVPCNGLTNNNIVNDVKCANKIYDRSGFSAWPGWVLNCQGRNVIFYVSNCNL